LSTKHLSHKFKLNLFNLQTNIILQNLKQTLSCTNHIFIQQISMRKNYKTSKHQNKIYIQQKYAIKINILKLILNKKWVVLLI